MKEGVPFARDLSIENSSDSYLCFRLTLLHSVPYFFLLYRSLSSSLCTVFDSISSNIDEVLSINLSGNIFVFGDFNVHHKDWLTYSGGTDRPGELCYNFSISNDLTQMVNFPTRIPDCDSHSPALLDLFISSDASICSSMAFPLKKFWSCLVFSIWKSQQVLQKACIMISHRYNQTGISYIYFKTIIVWGLVSI